MKAIKPQVSQKNPDGGGLARFSYPNGLLSW